MWGRICECFVGIWLVISPFIFRHAPDETLLWSVDLGVGGAVIVIALTSIHRKWKYLHLLNLAAGCVLVSIGYFYGGHPTPPGFQNEIIAGLLLLIFAVIPNNASEPPPSWRQYLEHKSPM